MSARRARGVITAVVLGGALLTLSIPLGGADRRVQAQPEAPVTETPVTVTLASQTWFVPGNGQAELTVKLDTTGIPQPSTRSLADRRRDPPVRIDIDAYRPIATTAQLEEFITAVDDQSDGDDDTTDDSTTDDDDTVSDTTRDVLDESNIVDSVRVDLRDTRMRKGRIVVRVVVEPEDDDDDELAMPQQGVHPLVIRVWRGDDMVAQLPTFVERLAWETTEPSVDSVTELAIWGQIDAPPTLQPSGRTLIDDTTIAELVRVRQTLTDLAGVPLTLAVRPELIEGLSRSDDDADRALLEGVARALDQRPLISEPFVAMDPSAMVAADLNEVYIDALRRGEDVVTNAFPGTVPLRSVAAVTSPLTASGADLLRDMGVRNVVLLDRAAPTTVDVDASLAREIALPAGGALQAHVVDPAIAARVDAAPDDPALFANHFVARLLLWQRELILSGADPNGRSFVLTTSQGALPESSTLEALRPLVARDPRLRFSTLDSALGRTNVATIDGMPEVIDAVTTPAVDLSEFARRLRDVEFEVDTTGSMLPTDDDRIDEWRALLEITPSESLDDSQRAVYLDTVAEDMAALRAAVVPPPETTFTLGGRTGDVNLSLRNDGDVALTVVVRMSSPKLLFPDGPATAELAPGATTIVRIPVEARSNNTFPVTVEVLTPSQLVPIVPPVQLTARVTAFTGLGQVVTGAGVLILATWWVRHWRSARRRRLAATAPVT